MRIPFLDLRTQYLELKEKIDAAALRALDSGRYILGSCCEVFELSFKEYLAGDREGYVIGVNSGTDALKLSLLAAGIGVVDEVITVANTAIPTAAAIRSTGAIPIFCDVNPKTWLMEPELIEPLITGRTRAIIPVHLYGTPCDLAPILKTAERHGLVVIEDVAQATGAEYGGNKCGTIGDYGAFSFYPSKNLGACGDGGAIFVRSAEKRDILTKLRNYGQGSRYSADLVRGENSRLDEIQAAILSVKLRHLDRWNAIREESAQYYRESLARRGLHLLTQEGYPGSKSAHHLFVIKTLASVRNALIGEMEAKGVQTLIHYPHPLHRQKAFASSDHREMPVTDELCASILSLPFHQYLVRPEMEYVVQSLAESLEK